MDVNNQDVSSYGIISPGKTLENNMTEILGLIEKPSIDKAPSNMAVVGRYIIEPSVFNELEKQNRGTSNEIQLTDAIANRIGKSHC
jgi:UTP--glucose-1-phosphate uridylyltransferase